MPYNIGKLLVLVCLFSTHVSAQDKALLQYVKPLTGTDRMGHTYPGATVPFGMVQLSPETDTQSYELNGKYNKDIYKYCAGYQYGDQTIVGFTHTHFSGTGHSDLGDILIMPTTGKLQMHPGTADAPETGFRSRFSHSTEVAEPNYYKVQLEDHNIKAEMTTTTRVGFHQYTFPKSDSAHIILDMMYGIYNYADKNVWTFLRVENDSLVTGYRQTNGWGRTRTVYFAIAFSKPFKHYGYQDNSPKEVYRGFWRKFKTDEDFPEIAGKQIRMHFDFSTQQDEQIKIKVALSPVSTANAMANMKAEVPGWDFTTTKRAGQLRWNKELNKIDINADEETMQNFYTAMYHAFINPTVYMDADGSFRGLDQQDYGTSGFTNYTTFSLWDTYRALHPFLNLVQTKRNADMIQSMEAHYDQSVHKMLPVWSNSANENWCMIGYHAVSVLADAVVKDNPYIDGKRALEACVTTARHRSYDGLGYYMDMGYVPEDKNGSSVSKTLEYAYDDWCIAQMAKKLGRKDIYQEFFNRAQNYHHVYDSSIGFMRPRMSDGTFKKQFDILNTDEAGFIEGNAWNYSLYVPHAPEEMIRMMGGNKRFVPHLDSLFNIELPDKYFEATEDITRDGIIGNYVHGNEPSHHVAYLYNWTDHPEKTQERVRMILKRMYHPTPAGLSGNDDCGQMSAWYIFSALGFYPVCPGSVNYSLGSPAIKEATLHFENGKTLHIVARNQSDKHVHVKKVTINGREITNHTITHEDITGGGELVFWMK